MSPIRVLICLEAGYLPASRFSNEAGDSPPLNIFIDGHTARQSCTVQPRKGSPQPDCTYFPFSTMHGTVGSPFENLNISARYSRLVCASRSINAMPFEL